MPANYVLLQRIELNDSAASVTFSNIPQSGYTDLKIVWSLRQSTGPNNDIYISFNGSTSSFSSRSVEGAGAATNSGTVARYLGTVTNTTANTFASGEVYIPNYTSSNNKSFSSDNVGEANATQAYATLAAGLWSNTAAINSVTITPGAGNWVQYSTFSLYGLAAVGTTPVIAPKATGGNITTDGTYWYHTFLSTGTFTPLQGLTCSALVIAGGGAGSYDRGAGGGAGGLSYISSSSLIATSYTVTVGAGGTGATAYGIANNGTNSTFNSITSNGGGGGGTIFAAPRTGAAGGSGGGAGSGGSGEAGGAANQGNTGGATGYGNAGGASSTSGVAASGGGGGAGAAGAQGGVNVGGAGGVGLTNSTINTLNAIGAATSTGQLSGGNYYYAGGGGGSVDQGSGNKNGGAGGLGGGGAGGSNAGTAGTAGTINTGGGGGGGANNPSANGGSGGSGIVIIRYPIA